MIVVVLFLTKGSSPFTPAFPTSQLFLVAFLEEKNAVAKKKNSFFMHTIMMITRECEKTVKATGSAQPHFASENTTVPPMARDRSVAEEKT